MKQRTFRTQLVISYLLITLILFFVISGVFLGTNLVQIRDDINSKLAASAELVSAQFSYTVKNMSFISTHTLSDIEFSRAAAQLNMGTLDGGEELEKYQTIQSVLVNYSIVSSIYRVTFFNESGYVATSDSYNLGYSAKSRLSDEDWAAINWLDRVQDNYGKTVLLPVQQRLLQEEAEETLMLVRAIRHPGNVVGYLIVDARLKDISNILYHDENSTLVIVDQEGQIIYQDGEITGQLAQGQMSLDADELEKMGYYSAVAADEELGISILMLAPHSRLWEEASRPLWNLILECILLFGIAVLAIFVLSTKLTRPLTELTEHMHHANLSTWQQPVRREMHKYTEIKALYSAYSNMQERLHMLIDREIAWKTQQAEQRLETLQAQINPHFMYNTLNMIGIMGLESQNRKVFEACRDFSNLLRYSISDKNGSISTIGKELDNIRNYLALMQMRFEKTCEYEIIEDTTVSDQQIPRLVLQPLVENIFEHGYDRSTEVVHIHIATKREGDRWHISIIDDGCGLSPEKMQKLREEVVQYISQSLHADGNNHHMCIGLKNTLSRLNLFFDEDFNYSISHGNPGFQIELSGKWEGADKPC